MTNQENEWSNAIQFEFEFTKCTGLHDWCRQAIPEGDDRIEKQLRLSWSLAETPGIFESKPLLLLRQGRLNNT